MFFADKYHNNFKEEHEEVFDVQERGSPVMLTETLQAGLVFCVDGSGKEFSAFELAEGVERPTYVRPCTQEEKKRLRKLVYGMEKAKSIRHPSPKGDDEQYMLLYIR